MYTKILCFSFLPMQNMHLHKLSRLCSSHLWESSPCQVNATGPVPRARQHLALGGSARPWGVMGPFTFLNALNRQQILKEVGEKRKKHKHQTHPQQLQQTKTKKKKTGSWKILKTSCKQTPEENLAYFIWFMAKCSNLVWVYHSQSCSFSINLIKEEQKTTIKKTTQHMKLWLSH